jgi:hypothetical protein
MKFIKWSLILGIAVPLLLIAAAYIRNKAVGPTGWAEDNTMKELRAKMKDPDSLVIKSSYFVHRLDSEGDEEILMCGILDGKNSFGGYTGGMRFTSRSVSSERLGTFDTYTVEMEDPEQKAAASTVNMLSAFEKVYWNEYCVDEKHPPLTVENP